MSEPTETPEVLEAASQRAATRLFSPMKRMRDDHQNHDGYPNSHFRETPGPLPTPIDLSWTDPYYDTLPLQQYKSQLQKLRQLKEGNKNQDIKAWKRPRLQVPAAPEPGDTDTFCRMPDPWGNMAKAFDSGSTGDTPGTLYWERRDTDNAAKGKKDSQQTAAATITAETAGAETPATPAKKDEDEVVGVLIRELWNDIRKSVAEVSKLKDDKIADQQAQIEQLKAEAENYRKKIKNLRAQRKDMVRLEGEIESFRSQIQYFKDQCKYHCDCENCKDYESEEESQTD